MKLIHCADLHLDSPMESGLTPEMARERRGEILGTFARMIRTAGESGVEAILIAGDLFDSERAGRRTEKYVLDLIKAHPEIFFFYLAGNHDRGGALRYAEEKPENLGTFEDGWTSYPLGEVVVTGSEKPDGDTLSLREDKINIVMLHGQERQGNGAKQEDIIRLGKLKGKNIDYLALGHIHAYKEIALDRRGTACYAGCLEGRGFDECGQKGYVLLETEGKHLRRTFVPAAKRTLHTVECDITGADMGLGTEERIRKATEGIPGEDLVKIVLAGNLSADAVLDRRELERRLNEQFYFAKIKDRSRICIRPEDYRNDISLKGEFVRRVMASGLSEEEKEKVIACGFSALRGEEIEL